MTAPACPRLAAELTDRILDVTYSDELSLGHYQAYLWLMSVLLNGGWADFNLPQYEASKKWLTDTLGFWDVLQPWLTDKVYTDEDILVHLVDRELFDTPRP